jgi:hypothetical protein
MYIDKSFNFPQFGMQTGQGVDLSIGAYPLPVVLFDDFLLGTPLTAAQTAGPWAVQGVGTELAPAALAASTTGEVTIGTGSSSGDTCALRTPIPLRLVAGKPAAAICRMLSTTITTQNIWFGLLAIGGDTPLTSTNFQGAGFAVIDGQIRYGASATAVAYAGVTTALSTAAVAATYIDMAVVWTGSKCQFYLNQTLVGESTVAPTGIALYLQAGVHTTGAASKTATIDYLGYNALR